MLNKVFGIYERDSSFTYMEPVKARNASTLLKIIYRRCRDRSIIYSDCWKAYNDISRMKNFEHHTVNRSLHFVDPVTNVHTNAIESAWRVFKQKSKQMHGIKRGHIQSYMDEHMWKMKNKAENLLDVFLTAISSH